MNMKNIIIGSLLLAFAGTAAGQVKRVAADKIVGVVGDKIVLKSDVTNALLDAQRQGQEIPKDAECMLMDQILTQKALVLQAEKDSLQVSDEELEGLLDNRVRYFISQYGSKDALEQIAGRTVYQIKEDFRLSVKEGKQAELMRNKIVENIKITPTEVKNYYDKIPKDSLAFYESEVEVGELIVYPKANRELEKYAIEELNDFKKQVESGEKKFETLASLYTDDPGSKNTGGMYNINRMEKQWDPAFLSAAFRLKDGQVSPVFKSKFGYHIIQMVNRAGDDAVVRHILKIPEVTSDEIKQATTKLDSVRAQLMVGNLGFGEAVAKYSEDENSKFTGGMKQCNGTTYCTIDQLEKDVVVAMKSLSLGEFSQPIASVDERGKKVVRLIYLKTRTEPHRENLKDDYNKVAQRALEEKKISTLEKWFDGKLSTYYIKLDDDFRGCEALAKWYNHAVKN
jgi:peptidyl-prolyl cis-trans isomerase SurA